MKKFVGFNIESIGFHLPIDTTHLFILTLLYSYWKLFPTSSS